MNALYPGFFTDVPGFLLGHSQNEEWGTGCTVAIAPLGTVGGVDVRGGAPGSRETDLLRPENQVSQVNAVMLAGGSSFGLEAACGIMEFLVERGLGFDTGYGLVPIVPSAILFDLPVGRKDRWPNLSMGREAAEKASAHDQSMGNVGAGCGATVGKLLGMSRAMKSGLGQASLRCGDLIVSAVVAVNALGDVFDPIQGNKPLAGLVDEKKNRISTTETFFQMEEGKRLATGTNTTIGCIATNGRFDKAGAQKISQIAHDGMARAIRPVHTLADGDTLFTLASGKIPADVNLAGMLAAEAVQRAIVNAVLTARGAYGLPAYEDLQKGDRKNS